jgi:hypothetical protein
MKNILLLRGSTSGHNVSSSASETFCSTSYSHSRTLSMDPLHAGAAAIRHQWTHYTLVQPPYSINGPTTRWCSRHTPSMDPLHAGAAAIRHQWTHYTLVQPPYSINGPATRWCSRHVRRSGLEALKRRFNFHIVEGTVIPLNPHCRMLLRLFIDAYICLVLLHVASPPCLC